MFRKRNVFGTAQRACAYQEQGLYRTITSRSLTLQHDTPLIRFTRKKVCLTSRKRLPHFNLPRQYSGLARTRSKSKAGAHLLGKGKGGGAPANNIAITAYHSITCHDSKDVNILYISNHFREDSF